MGFVKFNANLNVDIFLGDCPTKNESETFLQKGRDDDLIDGQITDKDR